MTRLLAAIAATALIASPALAGSYVAKPAAAPADAKITGKDIRWNCAGGSCHGTTELSRPVVLCQDLAKKAGRIDSFLADGRALAADELAKCNKDAKGGSAVANAN
ncbi:CC_3452 family protein [Sphingomonas jaspsi]|uniref:CC_3452 family protein n=1 Tax=Sphingomonas jaspsi TaxID=392409 RepID=UPI0004B5B67F|nr:hypothetical protein [Sphingomonas jaspsi]